MGLKRAGAARALRNGFVGSGLYIGVLTDDTTELSGGGYERIGPLAAGAFEQNSGWFRNTAALEFPEPSSNIAAPVLGGIWDAATAGNLLFTIDLTGDPAAPNLGAAFGWDAGALRIRFDNGGALTSAGSTEAFLRGVVGGSTTTRYVSLHTQAPGAQGGNQAGNSLAVVYNTWSSTPSALQRITNAVEVNFGVQVTDLPDPMFVALRSGSAANADVLWSIAFSNNPADPEIGDRLSFPIGGLQINFTVDA